MDCFGDKSPRKDDKGRIAFWVVALAKTVSRE